MSSFSSISLRPKTSSGEGVHVINLNHKYSRFNPHAQPAINIEELNSGIYALKHLALALQSAQASPETFINANNTAFPVSRATSSFKNPIKSSVPIPKTITGTTVAAIQENAALALIPEALQGLEELISTVTAIDLSRLSTIATTQMLLASYQGKTSLSDVEQRAVFSGVSVPSPEGLSTYVKTEQAEEIQQGQTELREKLEASNTSEDAIEQALANYETSYVENFIAENIEDQLLVYRARIGNIIKDMNQALIGIQTQIPAMTPENVKEINGQTMLQAIYSGLQDAITQEPSLGGDSEVIQMIQVLSPLLTKQPLTDTDLSTIYRATELPNKTALDRYLTASQAATYRDKITGTYQTLILNLNEARRTIDTKRKAVEEQLALFQETNATMTAWMECASKLKTALDGRYGSSMLTVSMELDAALISMSYAYENLSPEEKTLLDTYVPQFLNLQVITGGDLVFGWISKTEVYQILADYCLHNAVTNTTQMQTYARNQGQKIAQQHFFSDIGSKIQSITNDYSFANYYFQKNGNYYPDLNKYVTENLLGVGAIPDTFVSQAQSLLQQYSAAANAHIQSLQQQIASLETQYENLDPGTASFTNQRAEAVQEWLRANSLGSAFIYMILNSQLPKQANFLEPLIKEINFNNLAANALNNLLSITNSFAITSVYYNFSSYLIESKEGQDLFCGDYFDTIVGMSREREYITRDSERCKRALALAQSLLTKVKNLEGVDEAQLAVMINSVTRYIYSLAITLNQLTVLDSLFVSVSIEPQKEGNNNDTYDKDTFKITSFKDWIPTLAALEGFIANGFPDITPTGGLSPIFSQVQTDQQNYTTQSQTQQLNLQNQMTNIQQEWTLVSTSMQILNQILTQLAGAIYN